MAVQRVENILMGPASLYFGALGVITAQPDPSLINVVPAASAWTDAGGTNGGATYSYDPKFTPLVVDQVVDNLGAKLTSRDIMVTATLAETTLANLALAMNTSLGASGSNYQKSSPDFGPYASQPLYRSFILDGLAPKPDTWTLARPPKRRIYLGRSLQVNKVEPAYEKDKQVGFDVQFAAYYVSATVPPVDITDETSATS